MLDDSDVGDFAEEALEAVVDGGGWTLLALLAVVAVLVLIVANNRADCSKTRCHAGLVPKVTQHQCLCVEK
jgi:hypothetical protein